MTLYLHSFRPDLGRLLRLAARERLLPPGDDPGYAIHAAFAAAFGEHAPKPWVLLPPGQGGGPAGRLLAYAAAPLDLLRQHAAIFADPAFSGPLAVDNADSRLMPTEFPAGTRLGFRVRLRPVARTGRPRAGDVSAAERGERARERDVYLARIADEEQASATPSREAGGTGAGMNGAAQTTTMPLLSRATCYLEWLDQRLRDRGASIAREEGQRPFGDESLDAPFAARVEAFRLTRLLARDRSGAQSRTHHPEGPDATITGTLIVNDPARFAEGLAHGVGRFRAFGFGMLLLSPPRG